MLLSIIIVNWNTKDLLRDCLKSIYAYPPNGSFEVIVVDNASVDGSGQMVKCLFPQVILLENGKNIGFARANNQGAENCTGDYILFLNPDTLVKPDALNCLIAHMEKHPQVGACGPRLVFPDGSLQLSCSPLPTLFRETLRLFHIPPYHLNGYYAMANWDLTKVRQVEVILGACLVVRRKAVCSSECFDSSFFMFSEEVDLCYRLGKSGWQLHWVPQAEVVHYGGESVKQAAAEMFIQLYRAKIQFFRKHHGMIDAFLYKSILGIASAARLLITPLAYFEPKPQSELHLNLARNYYKLLTLLPSIEHDNHKEKKA